MSRTGKRHGSALSMLLALALVLSFSLVATTPVAAATLTVDTGQPDIPPNYHTIQAAIDAAVEGDTIMVAPGTYTFAPVDGDGSPNAALKFGPTVDPNKSGITLDLGDAIIEGDGGGIGIWIQGTAVAGDHQITNITIKNGTIRNFRHGIVLKNAKDITIDGVEIADLQKTDGTKSRGVWLLGLPWPEEPGIHGVTITGSYIHHVADVAVFVQHWASGLAVTGSVVENNTAGVGFFMSDVIYGYAATHTIHWNCIPGPDTPNGNAKWSIFSSYPESVTANNNWYGRAVPTVYGPMPPYVWQGYDIIFVHADVHYDPWLTGLAYTDGTSFTEADDVVLEATLSSSDNGAVGATVDFYVDGNHVGSAHTDVNGVAELDIGRLAAGNYGVIARTAGCLEVTAEIAVEEVPPPRPPTAGPVYPVWIVLLAGLMAGASLLGLRRRRVQT